MEKVICDFEEINDQQRRIAKQIDDILGSFDGCLYLREDFPDSIKTPVIVFVLTPVQFAEKLTITFSIYQDTFYICCNNCKAEFHSAVSLDIFEDWMKECIEYVQIFLHHPIRLRERISLFGNKKGAIYFKNSNEDGNWIGDLLAVIGLGKVYQWDAWRKVR